LLPRARGCRVQPGLNEELAATAVAGTQLLGQVPGARHDGVVGFWYGENPGLDRAADAIRHSNVAGTAAMGGAVALIGDDPGSKSSTVPSSCEPMCQSMSVPLLAPGTVAEVIESVSSGADVVERAVLLGDGVISAPVLEHLGLVGGPLPGV
jgi:indolepyruvate ferredoxin oxidoreductase